jgi:hypothetical protein
MTAAPLSPTRPAALSGGDIAITISAHLAARVRASTSAAAASRKKHLALQTADSVQNAERTFFAPAASFLDRSRSRSRRLDRPNTLRRRRRLPRAARPRRASFLHFGCVVSSPRLPLSLCLLLAAARNGLADNKPREFPLGAAVRPTLDARRARQLCRKKTPRDGGSGVRGDAKTTGEFR